jgi:hypothetical protein
VPKAVSKILYTYTVSAATRGDGSLIASTDSCSTLDRPIPDFNGVLQPDAVLAYPIEPLLHAEGYELFESTEVLTDIGAVS